MRINSIARKVYFKTLPYYKYSNMDEYLSEDILDWLEKLWANSDTYFYVSRENRVKDDEEGWEKDSEWAKSLLRETFTLLKDGVSAPGEMYVAAYGPNGTKAKKEELRKWEKEAWDKVTEGLAFFAEIYRTNLWD